MTSKSKLMTIYQLSDGTLSIHYHQPTIMNKDGKSMFLSRKKEKVK